MTEHVLVWHPKVPGESPAAVRARAAARLPAAGPPLQPRIRDNPRFEDVEVARR